MSRPWTVLMIILMHCFPEFIQINFLPGWSQRDIKREYLVFEKPTWRFTCWRRCTFEIWHTIFKILPLSRIPWKGGHCEVSKRSKVILGKWKDSKIHWWAKVFTGQPYQGHSIKTDFKIVLRSGKSHIFFGLGTMCGSIMLWVAFLFCFFTPETGKQVRVEGKMNGAKCGTKTSSSLHEI